MKRNNDKELKIIKDFITKINNGKINESNAASEFKKLKQKVNNDKLKHDLVNHLVKSLLGEDIESIEPEEKYEESIAERVKTRRQNAPLSPPKKDFSEETADYLKYIGEQEKGQKRFSDDYDSNGLSRNAYQQHSRVLFTFVPTKQYGQLTSISPHSLVFLKTMNTDFSEIEVWLTDQNNNALEIEDNVNISLIINIS